MTPMSQHYGVVKLDNASAVLTNITPDILGATVTPKKNVGFHHTLGVFGQFATEGGGGLSIQITPRRQTGTGNAPEILSAWFHQGSGERTFELYQPNELTGAEKLTGECVLAGGSNHMQMQGGSGEAAQQQWTLESTGAFTRSIVV